jgi:hypothetical protein
MMRSLPGLLAVIGLGSTAQAGYIPATWTDHVDGGVTLNRGDSITYTHDISDGFNIDSDLVHDFLLSISLYDDEQEKWYDIEAAFVDIPGWLGDAPVWKLGNDAYQGWSLAGLAELNLFGSLTVSITSVVGDFVFGGSDLFARGQTDVSVPEPATLGLLGMGLLGIAAGNRRRKVRN